jgi:DNA-binding FadR family transcriptional regulator
MAITRRKKRSEHVVAGIKQLILDKGLKAGDRLPTEQEMAARFGVSRISVREATKALGFLGIIEAAPRRGLSLGDVDMQRVAEYLGFHLALADYPKQQLWRARFAIETGALPFAAEALRADTALYENLRSAVDNTRHTTDVQQRVDADIAFHRALLEASGAGPLVAFNDLLQIFFDRLHDPNPPESQWDKTVEQHHRLVEDLRAGELDAAHATLCSHFNEYADRLGD